MAFNPLDHRGRALEDQLRPWTELTVEPFDPREVHPYTRTRVILMNGIEVEATMFSHQFARHTDNLEIRRSLALTRRVEQQQQKIVNGLNPGTQSPLETTIGYEQVAVDLTAWLARHEADPLLRQALDFALLEDFDHLYRYANLYDLLDGKDAAELTGHLTEIMPGRPTALEHRHPYDDVRGHYETHTVHAQSRLNVMTIVAAEQQTMNYYMNHGAEFVEPIARGLYNEIAMIEEQHVTHYGSLLDPLDSWLKQLVFHEYDEVWLYWSMHRQETDPRIRMLWEEQLDLELGHLHEAARLLRRYEGVEAAEILPKELPEHPLTFESNVEYVRGVLATQVDLRTDGLGYASLEQLDDDQRSAAYQRSVELGASPSERVVERTRARAGEYRDELAGPHPVDWLRLPVGAGR